MANRKVVRSKEEPNFFADVYEVVRLVPRGRVTSYGAIARYLGTGMSARMVRWAMNACHGPPDVPAQHAWSIARACSPARHHFGSPTAMENRLKKDGVKVVKDKVVDFGTRLWDPSKELL